MPLLFRILLEAAIGIEPMNKGFADLCLTTWLRRPNHSSASIIRQNKAALPNQSSSAPLKPFALSAPVLAPDSKLWSGRRDLNSRLSPWQGDTLPLSYSRSAKPLFYESANDCQAQARKLSLFSAYSVQFFSTNDADLDVNLQPEG
jgi:hypothetical protein